MILLMLTNVVETMAGKHPMDALREDGSGFYKGDEAVLFLSGPNITGAASIQNLHIPTNQVDEGFFANTRTAVFSFSQNTLKYCCSCWTYLIIFGWGMGMEVFLSTFRDILSSLKRFFSTGSFLHLHLREGYCVNTRWPRCHNHKKLASQTPRETVLAKKGGETCFLEMDLAFDTCFLLLAQKRSAEVVLWQAFGIWQDVRTVY